GRSKRERSRSTLTRRSATGRPSGGPSNPVSAESWVPMLSTRSATSRTSSSVPTDLDHPITGYAPNTGKEEESNERQHAVRPPAGGEGGRDHRWGEWHL